MSQYVVYLLEFKNNKKYIGATKNLKSRLIAHKNSVKSSKKRPIISAIKKYKSFQCTVLKVCDNKKWAEVFERYFIAFYGTTNINLGYNLSPGGFNGNIMSESGRARWKEKMGVHLQDKSYVKKITSVLLSKEVVAKKEAGLKDYLQKNPQHYKTINKGKKRTNEVRLKKALSMGAKPFICVETGQIFNYLAEASEVFGVDKRRIHSILTKRRKTIFKKYSFKYLEER